jgi:DNA-binding transcriptional MerR regulator
VPRPKEIPYAFTPKEASRITGISVHMLNYLYRMGYLQPAYLLAGAPAVRGKVRYYLYRDLVVGRTIQRLRETGVELARLKDAMKTLAQDDTWLPKKVTDGANPLRWLVTDGKEVFLENDDGFVDQLRPNGQRSFGFVISLVNIKNEAKTLIPRGKRGQFSMRNKALPDKPTVGRIGRG